MVPGCWDVFQNNPDPTTVPVSLYNNYYFFYKFRYWYRNCLLKITGTYLLKKIVKCCLTNSVKYSQGQIEFGIVRIVLSIRFRRDRYLQAVLRSRSRYFLVGAGAGVKMWRQKHFLLLFSLFLYEKEPEPVKKKYRLCNTVRKTATVIWNCIPVRYKADPVPGGKTSVCKKKCYTKFTWKM